MPTRDNYQISGSSMEEVKRSLNFLLQRFADRMDKIEGIRGTASIESTLDMNGNKVVDLAAATDAADALPLSQFTLTGTIQVFESVVLTNELSVGGDASFEGSVTIEEDVAVQGNISVYDSGNVKIHSME